MATEATCDLSADYYGHETEPSPVQFPVIDIILFGVYLLFLYPFKEIILGAIVIEFPCCIIAKEANEVNGGKIMEMMCTKREEDIDRGL